MRKVAIITAAIIGSALFTSCACSKSAGNGYFGVSNQKNVKKQQKEFQKPKLKIKKCKVQRKKN